MVVVDVWASFVSSSHVCGPAGPLICAHPHTADEQASCRLAVSAKSRISRKCPLAIESHCKDLTRVADAFGTIEADLGRMSFPASRRDISELKRYRAPSRGSRGVVSGDCSWCVGGVAITERPATAGKRPVTLVLQTLRPAMARLSAPASPAPCPR